MYICFAYSRISYKWNHIASNVSCLTSFLQNDDFEMHPCGLHVRLLFGLLNSVLLGDSPTVSLTSYSCRHPFGWFFLELSFLIFELYFFGLSSKCVFVEYVPRSTVAVIGNAYLLLWQVLQNGSRHQVVTLTCVNTSHVRAFPLFQTLSSI